MYRPLLLLVLVVFIVEAIKPISLTLRRGKVHSKHGKHSDAKNKKHAMSKHGKFASVMNKNAPNRPIYSEVSSVFQSIHTILLNFIEKCKIFQDNKDYFLDISLGPTKDQLQSFQLLIDTGSPGTWVPRRGCKTYAPEPKHCKGMDGTEASDEARTYDATGRKTYGRFLAKYSLTVEVNEEQKSGQVKGTIVEDDIWVSFFGACISNSNFQLGNSQIGVIPAGLMYFGAATEVRMPDDYGIMGLSAINPQAMQDPKNPASKIWQNIDLNIW